VIYDILEVFNEKYKEVGDKLILDSYVLKDGLYIKVNDDGEPSFFRKATNKSKINGETTVEHCFSDENNINQIKEMDWFKARDYYSNVIDTSKSYDAPKKTIHNNNYLTLFMKIEEFLKTDHSYIKEKLFKKVINFKSFDSKNEKAITENYSHIIRPFSRKRDIVKKMKILKKIFIDMQNVANKYSPKEYIRIFFDNDIEKYKQESSVYVALKIYNDNKYSKNIDKIIYGLSNYNMGLNAKKPFLEQKTKKLSYPFMIDNNTALNVKAFFDWLGLQKYKIDLLPKIFLNRFAENGKPIISDFDYLPIKIEKLKKHIEVINLLQIKDVTNFEVVTLEGLEKLVDEIFYNKQLINNYFGEVYKQLNAGFANLIYLTRGAMVNYFKKYREEEFYQAIKVFGTNFAVEHLRQNRMLKAKESLNLKFSLIHHIGEEIMDINALQSRILDKLRSSNYDLLSSEEFFYLSGQIVKYLLDKSEQYNKKADLLEPFLRANNTKRLKEDIRFAYFKYKHAISLNHILFNNAMSLIAAYDREDGLSQNMDSFLVGILSNNLFYVKKEEN